MPAQEVIFPAAVANRLAQLITDEDDQKIVETLRGAMDAMLSVRSPEMSRATGTRYLLIEDWRVRVLAAKILAEMKHGRPNQSVDLKVSGSLGAPMSRDQAARELLTNWDDVKRIGDEHVRLLKQALPALPDGKPAQPADAQLVDVDLPG